VKKEQATLSELIIKEKLDKLNVKYIFQKSFIQGNNYCIVDFYIPKPYKICLEIDGKYHESEEQKERDKHKDSYLTNYRGFKVIRIKNEDCVNIDITQLLINNNNR
jgi:very-short-patch-repair endonuclease